ncbi:RagB/SusD family nutrient uptake outer membrane protein [Saccharicrinis sp. FJH54]|uniref:RagB/SusD family nutrient uptake outer membrane protein n=1 Tax=Saccharicrinis sp. FJH54 TaxID=3344665 RepID=UPI0035D428AD
MKRINQLIVSLFAVSLLLMSCDSLLNVDSDRFVTDENYRVNSPSDSLYSMIGVLTQLQKLSDSYVLLGELRGDLLDVTENADVSLKELNNFDITSDNPYVNVADYYSIINNCNYIIRYIDTTYESEGEKILVSQFVQAKTIRAWTYLQLVLNFGSALYYEDPILSIDEAKADYPEYDLYQLADVLIKDLSPWKNVTKPRLGSVMDYNLGYSFFPVRMVLGDLYLWTGDYLNAATEYHDLLYNNSYTVSENYQSYWIVENDVLNENRIYVNWRMLFQSSTTSERITDIATSSRYGHASELDNMSSDISNQMIVPSQVALNNWNKDLFFKDDFDIDHDLRGKFGSISTMQVIDNEGNIDAYDRIIKYSPVLGETDENVYETRIYRNALVYLRYAEAVNQLYKPNVAFAVLKNGLNNRTLTNPDLIPASEIGEALPAYMDFRDIRFNSNIGTVMRGQGVRKEVNGVWVDARDPLTDSTFVIPALPTLDDSVSYVDDLLIKELALETAFEGNRFQDLMRFALRRSDPDFLADRVAEKHTTNKEAIRTLLRNTDNWYLPKK